jgi:hypothetical protein
MLFIIYILISLTLIICGWYMADIETGSFVCACGVFGLVICIIGWVGEVMLW